MVFFDVLISLVKSLNDFNKISVLFSKHPRVSLNVQSKYGYTALHNAAWRGKPDMVKGLLKYGSDASIINEHNETALEAAIVGSKSQHENVNNEGCKLCVAILTKHNSSISGSGSAFASVSTSDDFKNLD